MPVRVARARGVANEPAIAVDAGFPPRHALGGPAVLAAPFRAREWAGRLSGKLSFRKAVLAACSAEGRLRHVNEELCNVEHHHRGFTPPRPARARRKARRAASADA